MTLAKICGLSTPEAVNAALEGGAAFLGFMFFAASPRDVAPELAARLAAPARGKAKVVAVMVDPDNVLLERIDRILQPDLIQLHGRETPARVAEIGRAVTSGLIKVAPVAGAADLDQAMGYESLVDHLLFETKPGSDATRPGGLGVSFDWRLMAGRRYQRPWFLAGGLNPWNLTEAVSVSGAPMVDVSSGVERGPGLKDPALIAAFLETARRL